MRSGGTSVKNPTHAEPAYNKKIERTFLQHSVSLTSFVQKSLWKLTIKGRRGEHQIFIERSLSSPREKWMECGGKGDHKIICPENQKKDEGWREGGFPIPVPSLLPPSKSMGQFSGDFLPSGDGRRWVH